MLHGPYPLADLLVQISGSNAGRIHWSNLSVEFLDQIGRSNCWVKLLDQIPRSNAANQTQPIHAPPLASLGQCMDAPTDSPKTGKDGRETGKEKAHAVKRGPVFNC